MERIKYPRKLPNHIDVMLDWKILYRLVRKISNEIGKLSGWMGAEKNFMY